MSKMQLPGVNDLRWLRKQLSDESGPAIRVVVDGYIDEVTDWLGGLVKLQHEYDQLCIERNWWKRAGERKGITTMPTHDGKGEQDNE